MKNTAEPIKCPKCGNENIRSYDNEPVYHPTIKDIEAGSWRIDPEVYMKLVCIECGNKFNQVFTLVPKEAKGMRERILDRLAEVSKTENGYPKSTTRWTNFNLNGVHLSEIDLSKFDDEILLHLFERIIRQCQKQF